MPPPGRAERMEGEVDSMEQRLQMLKAMMADEMSKREAKRLPGGTSWRSARQDGAGTGSKYVDTVLKERPAALLAAGSRAGGSRADGAAAAPRALSAGRVGRLRAEADAASAMVGSQNPGSQNPLSGELNPTPPPPRPGRTSGPAAVRRSSASARAVAAAVEPPAPAAREPVWPNGEPEPFGQTRDISEMFSWRPGDAEPTGDYEDLLEPLDEPKQPAATDRDLRAGISSTGGGGDAGSQLDDPYDENVAAASFQEALRAWRGDPAPPQVQAQVRKPAERESAENIWARAMGASDIAKPAALQRQDSVSASTQGAGTQAGRAMHQMSFFEKLQEQKRRDGVLES
ncbi:hypothetical protein T492DRAFT_993665 [Pavlovales sp. CCMP2436]|nr:hypothetical protein T492DRAFT_993665 [Pavlovales sp. CCMP2436]